MPDVNLQQEKELEGVYCSGPIVDNLIHSLLQEWLILISNS